MKKKIVGILVCTLVIAAAVLPAAGIMTISNTKKVESSFNSDAAIEQHREDSTEINEPDENPPMPAATKIGYLSIPAAAFIAEEDDIDYFNFGTYVKGIGQYYAPVYLPHEATVTKVTFYWWDTSGGFDITFILIKYPLGDETETWMVECYSNGDSGDGFTEDNTIVEPKIDNIGHSYFLFIGMASLNMKFRNVLIEYTYETGGSSENIDDSQQTQVNQRILSR